MIPYPFSRGVFLWAAPMWVDRDAGTEAMERARRELETTLKTMASEAEAMACRPD